MIATYISYSSLRHAIDRNLLLAKDVYNKLEGDEATTDRNEDVHYQNLVKAYDNVVQVLLSMESAFMLGFFGTSLVLTVSF